MEEIWAAEIIAVGIAMEIAAETATETTAAAIQIPFIPVLAQQDQPVLPGLWDPRGQSVLRDLWDPPDRLALV